MKLSKTFIFFLLTLIFILPTAALAAPRQQEENLLQNPGFEGAYAAWLPQYGTAQMAAEWTPWWVEGADHDPLWAQPEYKPAEGSIYPDRVLEGERAQQYFTFHKSHHAGIFQHVSNVNAGTTYRFTIWAQVWSSVADDVNSVDPANPRLRIGIDPTGAVLPGVVTAPPSTVIWSNEAPMDCVVDRWCPLVVDVTADSDAVSVYIVSSPDFANKHNDLYFDKASLTAVDTPSQNTPEPTDEATEAAAEIPATVEATATATEPPPTPLVTETATAIATETATPVLVTVTPTSTVTQGPTSYVVQPGETLFRIATRFGLTVDVLAQFNNISDPTRIFAGQTLLIPGANDPLVLALTATPVPSPLSATATNTSQPATTIPTATTTSVPPTLAPTEAPPTAMPATEEPTTLPQPTTEDVPATVTPTQIPASTADDFITPTEIPSRFPPESRTNGLLIIGGLALCLISLIVMIVALLVTRRRGEVSS